MPTSVPRHNLRILGVACLLAACSGDAAGPANEPGFEPRYDVTVTVRYLEVSSSEACDGVGLINGEARDGEFQYRIEVESDRFFGFTESDGYGTFLGENFSRLPRELINFANRDFRIEFLEPGESVTISLFGTEWDGAERDSRMDNLRTERVVPSTFDWQVGTFRDLTMTIPSPGSLVCELTLVWDLSVTSRMVPVP
jgi:hypothetical protein